MYIQANTARVYNEIPEAYTPPISTSALLSNDDCIENVWYAGPDCAGAGWGIVGDSIEYILGIVCKVACEGNGR